MCQGGLEGMGAQLWTVCLFQVGSWAPGWLSCYNLLAKCRFTYVSSYIPTPKRFHNKTYQRSMSFTCGKYGGGPSLAWTGDSARASAYGCVPSSFLGLAGSLGQTESWSRVDSQSTSCPD